MKLATLAAVAKVTPRDFARLLAYLQSQGEIDLGGTGERLEAFTTKVKEELKLILS